MESIWYPAEVWTAQGSPPLAEGDYTVFDVWPVNANISKLTWAIGLNERQMDGGQRSNALIYVGDKVPLDELISCSQLKLRFCEGKSEIALIG